MLGRWLKQSGKRDQVVIATKVGMEMGPEEKGLSKAYIVRAVEKLLARLQVGVIDRYQSHQDDGTTSLEETLDAFATLLRQGKLREIGALNYTTARLAEALQISREKSLPRYETLQPLYNLNNRIEFEQELEPLCWKEGLGVITCFSLASGFLTDKYRRPILPRAPEGSP